MSAAIALLGVAATLYISRVQHRGRTVELEFKAKELELRSRELEQFSIDLESQFESLRQNQLTEILRARIAAYPKVWHVLLTYGRNWTIEGKPRDAAWARTFLVAINSCNAEFGVFFSEPVYARFHEFRGALTSIEGKLRRGEIVDEEEHSALARILIGDATANLPGLSTQLKNDLGSYRSAAIQQKPRLANIGLQPSAASGGSSRRG